MKLKLLKSLDLQNKGIKQGEHCYRKESQIKYVHPKLSE